MQGDGRSIDTVVHLGLDPATISSADSRQSPSVFNCKQFVWQAYGIGNIDPDVIPLDIRHNSVIWSTTVPLISFECIERHASDRVRRQFGLRQCVPNQERDLGASHSEVLTGPKNQDWANTHSFWVMQWTNRYSHTLSNDLVHLHYPLKIYMHWYREAFGDHLRLWPLAPHCLHRLGRHNI
ncbi:hypothetical protein Ahy_A10g048204 [Arachis hypogaea]|uniref:Aminotransferase-like plant mobile domain-containing protein n=1 Tax=Arachis hypogaea TaxID=3818 RepID=A0A445B4I8_ARAHY|nr:hypothetical protein Ahy_A10g048204 [Arachis hypogaea]